MLSKRSELRQIIRESIQAEAASELLGMLAHPEFLDNMSRLRSAQVQTAYEELYRILQRIERAG